MITCTACGEQRAALDPFHYDWDGRRFSILRCKACTHQFVHPSITAHDQRRIYDDHYFSSSGDWACGVFTGGYLEAQKQLEEEARQVLGFLPPPPGRLLDVGCAGGVFLDVARQSGFQVSGIELNPGMAKHARDTFRLDVITTRIEEVPPTMWHQPFDVVTIMDCLEHLPAPLEALRRVASWMRPGGTLFIRGPLANSRLGRAKEALRRLIRVSKRLPGYPLDANMFNPRSLTRCLASAGFQAPAWIGLGPGFANCTARRR